MKTSLKKSIESLSPGDLICCSWCDASIGKSSGSGMAIDVPVQSWGIYVGLIGEKVTHIVLAQNSFRYTDDLFDLDYTAIPLSWAVEISVLIEGHIPKDSASKLVNSFIMGGRRALYQPRISRTTHFQQRLSIDGRPN